MDGEGEGDVFATADEHDDQESDHDDGDESGDGMGCDAEDPLAEEGVVDSPADNPPKESLDDPPKESPDNPPNESPKAKKKSKQKIAYDPLPLRLEALAKPRPLQSPQTPRDFSPPPKPSKKKPRVRPSLLLRLKPTNLTEAWDAFVKSKYQKSPQFTYGYSEDVVAEYFGKNSDVCFEF